MTSPAHAVHIAKAVLLHLQFLPLLGQVSATADDSAGPIGVVLEKCHRSVMQLSACQQHAAPNGNGMHEDAQQHDRQMAAAHLAGLSFHCCQEEPRSRCRAGELVS